MHSIRAIKQKPKPDRRKGLEIRMMEIRPFRDLLWEKIIEKDMRIYRQSSLTPY